ncbi:MAG: hypothetical protein ACRD8O_21290 [Bryobacteraceae bacterium]
MILQSVLAVAALAADGPVSTKAASLIPEGERETMEQLLAVKRVYVDRLAGGDSAAQMRDLIISSLQNAKLFALTENPERADAVIRGAAEDLVYTEVHQSSENINARANLGASRTSSTESRGASGLSVGQSESSRIEDRRHEALATIRLVTKDGDVIWSTTQESRGAKFRGSSADVADKITRRLVDDVDRARKALR